MMSADDQARMQAQLPAGWEIMRVIEEVVIDQGTYEKHTFQVKSDRYNVVLIGSWSWILRKSSTYSSTPKV